MPEKNEYRIAPALLSDMHERNIDVALSLEILEGWNSGLYANQAPVKAQGVPEVDGERVVDLRSGSADHEAALFRFDARHASENLSRFGLEAMIDPSGTAVFSRTGLEQIGEKILPFVAFGLLNGGSATSYADSRKNLALGKEVFAAVEPWFAALAPGVKDMPKGIAPAFMNPDGSPGASFLELKIRAALLLSARLPLPIPLFQMTSMTNDRILAGYHEALHDSPWLSDLLPDPTALPAWKTGIQPMITAFSHSSEGQRKRIFDRAYGVEHRCLPLPGGHGQSFRVLSGVLKSLHARGIRYATLGNVDNLGYTIDRAELAIIAISGRPAGFDFAVRTPMDVKGGVLVQVEGGGHTVADIGAAIGFDDVLELERKGSRILFNCASGIFDLDWLVPRLDEISRTLPVRFSDQDKDAGRYSQAEQVTWEVLGLIPGFIAFAVDKKNRFIAAKLLVDTLLASGLGLDAAGMPADTRATARELNEGLSQLLKRAYGLALKGGTWLPR
jgi:hypothetical protein